MFVDRARVVDHPSAMLLRLAVAVGMVALILGEPTLAAGQLTVSAGSEVEGPQDFPPSLGMDELIQLYREKRGFPLDADLEVDILPEVGTYTAGSSLAPGWIEVDTLDTVVSCYLLHWNRSSDSDVRMRSGTIALDPGTRLLGLIARTERLNASDDVCAPRSDVMYPNTDVTRDLSVGPLSTGDDVVSVGADARTMTVTMVVAASGLDQMRIIVASSETEPESDAGSPADGGEAAAPAAPMWDYRGSGGCQVVSGRGTTGGAALLALVAALRCLRRRPTP